MGTYKHVFSRFEKKYLLTAQQYIRFASAVGSYVHTDEYGESLICSIYFDTENYRLIRNSMQSPCYKEKLRLRTYGVPTDTTPAFAEMKKKYNGVVYKRRVDMEYASAYNYLCGKISCENPTQITNEIDSMSGFYGGLKPSMVICYERRALYENGKESLRITFDSNIRWRSQELDLRAGAFGEEILPKGMRIMEIKTSPAMPLWLVGALSELEIYPTSFSKYAKAYTALSAAPKLSIVNKGGTNCA